MKRGAIVFAVLALLLFADGAYLLVSKNEVGGDTGVLFGNPHFFLHAGVVVLISSGFLILGAAIMWAVAVWRETRPTDGRAQVSQPQVSQAQVSQAQVSQPEASEARTEAGTAAGQAGKGQGHQRQT